MFWGLFVSFWLKTVCPCMFSGSLNQRFQTQTHHFIFFRISKAMLRNCWMFCSKKKPHEYIQIKLNLHKLQINHILQPTKGVLIILIK